MPKIAFGQWKQPITQLGGFQAKPNNKGIDYRSKNSHSQDSQRGNSLLGRSNREPKYQYAAYDENSTRKSMSAFPNNIIGKGPRRADAHKRSRHLAEIVPNDRK